MFDPSSTLEEVSASDKAKLTARLRAGRVYRREDLALLSRAVDRHLRELVAAGQLTRLAQGLYYAPRRSSFGPLPPDETALVAAFLRDQNFLIFSPAAYNSVGLGTTQLYNRTLVYNHKRHGVFKLGNRQFDFRVKPRFPRKLTPEFVWVDALNNVADLGEDQAEVMARARDRMSAFDRPRLQRALERYGSAATRKRLKEWLRA